VARPRSNSVRSGQSGLGQFSAVPIYSLFPTPPAWPGTRPLRWWQYDSPEPRRDDETEAAYLERHGLLLAGERKRMKKKARRGTLS
jgi:hypothetical protein